MEYQGAVIADMEPACTGGRTKESKKRFVLIIAWTLRALLLSLTFPALAYAYQAAPIARTETPTFITEKSARLNGEATPSDMPDTLFWFEWGLSGRIGTVYETPRRGLKGGNLPIDVRQEIMGLAPSTQYFYRLVAENARGKSTGSTFYFTTKARAQDRPQIAIVETEDPSMIEETRATIRGYVSPHGNAQTTWWFQWGTSQQLEYETPHRGKGADAGKVETSLTNLTPGTTYFYRTAAENAAGRVFGTTRVFSTRGTPPPLSEAPRSQQIPAPQSPESDTTSRPITTTPPAPGAVQGAKGETSGLPGTQTSRPGDILGAFFGRKQSATQTGTSTAASVSLAGRLPGPLGTFWNTLMGRQGVSVAIEKIGPKKVVPHTPVEYKITYAYGLATPADDARLSITLPDEVIYIGDDTNNELFVEEGGGAERTYVLPLGPIGSGSTRSISILGMTTGRAEGFPDARARLEYTDQSGVHVVAADDKGAQTTQKAAAGASDWTLLPNSLFDWILYIGIVLGAIFGIRKLREYYVKRREMLEEEEQDEEALRKDKETIERLIPKNQ